MDYAPKGKISQLVAAMRLQPNKTWTSKEAAEVMGIMAAQLPAYAEAAIRHGLIFRSTGSGPCLYALQPITAKGVPDATPSAAPPAFVPPAMVAPRPGSEQPRILSVPVASPAPAPTEAQPAPAHSAVVASWPAPAPTPQPIVEAEPEPIQEEDVRVEGQPFNACVWADGDIDLFGLQELENGGYRLTRENATKLRRLVAWMPAS